MEEMMDYYFKEYEKPAILTGHLNLGGSRPDGDCIGLNSLYFTRNNRPWIGIMGEFHYSRYPREDWFRELLKMKAGGITIVSTYVIWICHEEIEGELCFKGDNDLRGFVLEAERAGLEVMLRIGPWAHGECRNGGFPDWLCQKPYRLRCNDPEYLKEVRRYYSAIEEQVRGLLYPDGGPVVGIQLENELPNDAAHLAKLKEIAVECGIRAPLYTVTGWNDTQGARIPEREVLPVFGGYCEAPWTQHIEKLPPSVHYFFCRMRNDSAIGSDLTPRKEKDPDGWELPYERYPFATCELGGGIQVTHHRRPCIAGMDIYALALVKLGVGNNFPGYYMYHGGRNQIGRLTTFQESKETGYPNDVPILSYDFQAPISEYGEIREQYRLLNLLHLFLQDFGERFAPMSAVDAAVLAGRNDIASLRYGMRSDGVSGFVFVNHYQRLDTLCDVKGAVIHAPGVTFPEIDICGPISFFFPFLFDMDGQKLEYATAQPLCREGNAWFFVAIPGISAEYKLCGMEVLKAERGAESVISVGNIRIVTLEWEQALFFRRLDGRLYLGIECDLYSEEGRICSVNGGGFEYRIWNGGGFDTLHADGPLPEDAKVRFEDVTCPPFAPEYSGELKLGGERKLIWKKLTADTEQGFIEIADRYDTAQIYVGGKLAADSFYYGKPWRVPAGLIYGKEAYLVMSELKDDIYLEFRG